MACTACIKNKNGFTLIEMLIVIALIGLSMPLIFGVFFYGLTAFSTSADYAKQLSSINDAVMMVRNDIALCHQVFQEYDASTPPKPINKIRLVYVKENLANPQQPIKTEERFWWFENGKLFRQIVKYNDSGTVIKNDTAAMIEGIDDNPDYQVSKSKFKVEEFAQNTEFKNQARTFAMKVMPKNRLLYNDKRYENRNVTVPVVMEFAIMK